MSPELIWYPGIDGKVEREQIVCTFRRAMGFVHIEAYGDDLFVAWDTHVNGGTWSETTLTRGIDRATGRRVIANRVDASWQAPNEYDITDVNYLTEWLHSNVVQVVKSRMTERRIDQEIDFTIHRESRNEALAAQSPAGAGGGRTLLQRLRRVR